MKITKIRDDVWKFKGKGSVYLIKNPDPLDSLNESHPAGHGEWVLIDSGDPMDRDELGREISKIVGLDEINIILLTHLHYDHLGGLDLFPNAKVFASGEELQDYIENARGFHFYANDKVDKILREKAKRLKGSGFGLKIIKCPGHTRGSVAFLDEKRKLLFSGDTIFGGGIEGRIDLPNSIPEKMDDSVHALRRLVIDKGLGLCPGHGYWEDAQG